MIETLFPSDWDAQADVVDAVATTPPHIADPEFALFVDALRADALSHGGYVAVNRVRKAMSNEGGLSINPRRYSSFWTRAVREGYLDHRFVEEPNRDKKGRNLGKKSKVRRWLGGPR